MTQVINLWERENATDSWLDKGHLLVSTFPAHIDDNHQEDKTIQDNKSWCQS